MKLLLVMILMVMFQKFLPINWERNIKHLPKLLHRDNMFLKMYSLMSLEGRSRNLNLILMGRELVNGIPLFMMIPYSQLR